MHPAEFGKLASRYNLVGIAEACRKEANVGSMDGISNFYGSSWLLASPIPQEYDASTIVELTGIPLQSNLWKKGLGGKRALAQWMVLAKLR